VLLLGALEEQHRITADMVNTTADELNEDLGAGSAAPEEPAAVVAPPPPPPSRELDTLSGRILALEQGALRQERMLKRLLEIMDTRVPQ